jgi:hypothetical protein
MAKERAEKTNITTEHKKAFNAIVSGEYRNFALFSCFVNGKPSAAIVPVEEEGDEVKVTPLFVAVTEEMELADHDGNRLGSLSEMRKATHGK